METLFSVLGTLPSYNIMDKEKRFNEYLQYFFNRTSQIFEYENLPDTIPKTILELYLQIYGHCLIAKHENNLYCFYSADGGEPNEYYLPTLGIVSNPYLKLSKEYKLDDDCVWCWNDTCRIGLYPIIAKYSSLMLENDISFKVASINVRISQIMSAGDDNVAESIRLFYKQIEEGRNGVIIDDDMINSMKVNQSTTTNNSITQLIELQQYLKASLFNELGLQSNYNMKRESINSNESQLNEDSLIPLIDDMLEKRKEFVSKVNEMYGTNITVNLSSVWKEMREESEPVDEVSSREENNEKESEVNNNENIE